MAIYSDEEDPNVIQWERQQKRENKRRNKLSQQVKNKRNGNKKSSLRN